MSPPCTPIGIRQAAEELRPEIAESMSIDESDIHSITVIKWKGAWSAQITLTSGQTTKPIPLADPLAKRLSSPIRPADISRLQQDPRLPSNIPVELTQVARIEPALRWLGTFGFRIKRTKWSSLEDWLKGDKTKSGGYHTVVSSAREGDPERHFDPDKGEIIKVANTIASVLLGDRKTLPDFEDRWADFRGEAWARRPGESDAEFRRRTNKSGKLQGPLAHAFERFCLENWDPTEEHFETFLSRAAIGKRFWLTFGELKKNWKGLKYSLVLPSTIYGSRVLHCVQVPACHCPHCCGLKLASWDNNCEGTHYGHVPLIKNTGPERIVVKGTHDPAEAHECKSCGSRFFVPPTEIRRQRALALLSVRQARERKTPLKEASKVAAKLAPILTLKEIEQAHKALSVTPADEQEYEYARLEKQSRDVPFSCPNPKCGANNWSKSGPTFWLPCEEAPRDPEVDRYRGEPNLTERPDGQQVVDYQRSAPASEGEGLERQELGARLQALRGKLSKFKAGPERWAYLLLVCTYSPPFNPSKHERQAFEKLPPNQLEEGKRVLAELLSDYEY